MTKNYIPKSKSDTQAVENLKTHKFDFIRADVPKLLECLQDLHWDIAEGVAEYLTPYVNEIKNDLINVLDTNDGAWKFGVLTALIAKSPHKLDEEIIKVLRRIAEQPTKNEQDDDVDEAAKSIIENVFLC